MPGSSTRCGPGCEAGRSSSGSGTSGRDPARGTGLSSKTASDRLSRALKAVARWCRHHRHAPLVWQHAALSRKIRGHCSYYGITGNAVAITRFCWEV